jgi:hypothetical protein
VQRRAFIKTCLVLGTTGAGVKALNRSTAGETTATSPAGPTRGAAGAPRFPFYDPARIPFSSSGSFLTLNPSGSSGRLRIATRRMSAVSLKWMTHWADTYYEVVLLDGDVELPYSVEATPWQLKLLTARGEAVIAFVDPDTLHFHADGPAISLRPLLPIDYHLPDLHGGVCLYMFNGFSTHQLRARQGTALSLPGQTGQYMAPSSILATGPKVDLALSIRSHEIDWNYIVESGADVVEARQQEFERWMQRQPPASEPFDALAATAWFLLWNLQAEAGGLYTRAPVLMNKSNMAQVWGWDNCFVALAVAPADLAQAWDQILLFFDRQYETGMLPNVINDNYLTTGWTSPPVYGWTILLLIDRFGHEANLPYLRQIYQPLARMTRWWMKFRDQDGDGLCNYVHGNDSGWDNATMFDEGGDVVGVDLATYQILNFDCLGRLAALLDRPDEAATWIRESEAMLRRLLARCVFDDRLRAVRNGSHDPIPSRSLINYIPLLLGSRLPARVRAAMTEDLRPGGPYLTWHGYATEPPESPRYEDNGYWRGPIWAPSTYLLCSGLERCGERALAREVAARFCRMCDATPGMFENYNALTGVGQFASGFAWTAAACSLLASDLAAPA